MVILQINFLIGRSIVDEIIFLFGKRFSSAFVRLTEASIDRSG